MSYCSPILLDATNDYVLGCLSVEGLSFIFNFSENENKNSILKQIISEVTEDDNPVIFLYYFKNRYISKSVMF